MIAFVAALGAVTGIPSLLTIFFYDTFSQFPGIIICISSFLSHLGLNLSFVAWDDYHRSGVHPQLRMLASFGLVANLFWIVFAERVIIGAVAFALPLSVPTR